MWQDPKGHRSRDQERTSSRQIGPFILILSRVSGLPANLSFKRTLRNVSASSDLGEYLDHMQRSQKSKSHALLNHPA